MWTIEVVKCLLHKDEYRLSSRLEDNRHCSIDRIKRDAAIKRSTYDNINKVLKTQPCKSLLVCEVGRGLDIVMALAIQKWGKIYCYDHVDYSRELDYFPSVEFSRQSSTAFNPNRLPEDVIMIMNHSICKPFKNDKIIASIVDGELK